MKVTIDFSLVDVDTDEAGNDIMDWSHEAIRVMGAGGRVEEETIRHFIDRLLCDASEKGVPIAPRKRTRITIPF